MAGRLAILTERISRAETLEQLQTCILGLRDVYGVEHLVYHSVNSTGQQYAVLTYQDDWVEHYIKEDLGRIDPVVLGCFRRFNPVDWKHLDWSGKSARHFHAQALDAGVGNQGFSVPIRGPNGQFALFTVNHCCSDAEWLSFTQTHVEELILIAHFLNQKALEIERGSDQLPVHSVAPSLSPRETDALTLLALGLNRAQAAENLTISEHTLRVYIESARFKLGALNTTHAVARALSRGLLII